MKLDIDQSIDMRKGEVPRLSSHFCASILLLMSKSGSPEVAADLAQRPTGSTGQLPLLHVGDDEAFARNIIQYTLCSKI